MCHTFSEQGIDDLFDFGAYFINFHLSDLSQGPSWGEQIGEQILPWGSLCERTPLGDVLGNLAQAKTMVAHRTLFVLEKEMFCNDLSPFDSTTVTV